MACKYCGEDQYALIDTATKMSKKGEFYPGITAGVENGELWIVSTADAYEPSYLEAYSKINFCPMCGERLREELEE